VVGVFKGGGGMPLRLKPGQEEISGVVKVVIRPKVLRPAKKEVELVLLDGSTRIVLVDRVVIGCNETAELRINPGIFEVEYVSVTREPWIMLVLEDERGYLTLTNDPTLVEYPEW